jgi:hypothetical protein
MQQPLNKSDGQLVKVYANLPGGNAGAAGQAGKMQTVLTQMVVLSVKAQAFSQFCEQGCSQTSLCRGREICAEEGFLEALAAICPCAASVRERLAKIARELYLTRLHVAYIGGEADALESSIELSGSPHFAISCAITLCQEAIAVLDRTIQKRYADYNEQYAARAGRVRRHLLQALRHLQAAYAGACDPGFLCE